MTMIKVNIFEAKARLSEYLDRVAEGELVVICKRNQPVAELRPVTATRTEPRPLGLGTGQVEILPSFYDPVPDDLLATFSPSGLFPGSINAARAPHTPRKSPRPARASVRRRRG